MKFVVQSLGQVGSEARLGNHTLVFDQPKGVPGGEDRGPSPLDVMTVSVAACAHYFAAAVLHGRGMATEGLSVAVEADKDRTPAPRIGRLSIKVRLPPGVPERYYPLVERAIKGCPAYGTLRYPPDVELIVERDAALEPLSA